MRTTPKPQTWQEKNVLSRVRPMKFGLSVAIWLVFAGTAFAQTAEKEPEPAAIIELGSATSWNTKGGSAAFGPDLAVEFTPIKDWLEIEAGVTPLFTRNSTEWDADFLVKKPWTLSKKAEFMAGIGPEWVHTRQFGVTSNSVAGEAILDFMFWPAAKHKFGWFVEPGYEYNFGQGHERSLGLSAGLLIAIR
jgi:hypothetical protein